MKRLFSLLGKKDEDESVPPDPIDSGTFLTGDGPVDSRNVRLLLDTMAALISDTDPGAVVRRIVDRAVEVAGAERGILLLADGDGSLRVGVARDGRARDIEDEFRYSTTIVRQVFESGQGWSQKIGDSGPGADLSASVVDLKIRAVMCVQLRYQEKVLGVIYVDSRVTEREFVDSDLRLFDALSVGLSIALENSRVVQEALERQRLHQSLEIAQGILDELRPTVPTDIPGFDLAGHAIPAETAAGDHYDFIRAADGTIGLVIGDVTGHGIGPAMVVTGARAALRTMFEAEPSEARLLERLNCRLAEDLADDKFMSMIVARLDPAKRVLRYANAGQSAPLLVRADGSKVSLPGRGLALGIEADMPYDNEAPVEFAPGDVLVLYTDGIIEATQGDEQYGVDRLVAQIRATAQKSAAEIMDGVFDAVTRFSGDTEAEDDLTLIVLKAS